MGRSQAGKDTNHEPRATNPDRYARHHLLEGWDQARLARARVLVAGVGAVGNEVVKLLALIGVGNLILVDFDLVEMSNLTRSVLFRETDVGRSKAYVGAERARDLNPDITVRAVQGNLEFDVGLGVYRACDVVIGCLDSINARLALNRACRRAGVPWLNTGIEATIAEIALYGSGAYHDDATACFECAMSPEMWERRNQRFSCGGLHSDLPENAVPTTATVASLAAAFAVNEALLLLHGRKEEMREVVRERGKENNADTPSLLPSSPLSLTFGQKLFLSVAPYGLHTVGLPYSGACLAHERYAPVEVVEQGAGDITPIQLLTQAGMREGIMELGFDLLTRMRCLECGREEEILKPLEACSLALNYCADCSAPTRQPEAATWLGVDSPYANRTLADLGIPEHQILTLKDEAGRHYVQISGRLGAAA